MAGNSKMLAWVLVTALAVGAIAAGGSSKDEVEPENKKPEPGPVAEPPQEDNPLYAQQGQKLMVAVRMAVGYEVSEDAMRDMALSIAESFDATHNVSGYAMTPFLAAIVNKASPAWPQQDAPAVTLGKLLDWAGRYYGKSGAMEVDGTGPNKLYKGLVERLAVDGGGPPDEAYETCFELPDFEAFILESPTDYNWLADYGTTQWRGVQMMAALAKVDASDYCAHYGEVLNLAPAAWWADLGDPGTVVKRVAQEMFYVTHLRDPVSWDEAGPEIKFAQASITEA